MLRVAVIGVGHMGQNHVRVFSEIPTCQLVALADVDSVCGTSLSQKYQCHFYQDYHEMLDKEDIDAVSIVVPTHLHKTVALDVMQRGIHVLLEKPISDTLEDAYAIVRAAEENNVTLLIGHIERFNPAVNRLIKIVRQGRLGNITSLVATRVGLLLSPKKDTNVVIDLAVHDIDIMNYILDDQPREVYANGGKALLGTHNDYAEIFMKYGTISGFVVVNWITPLRIRKLCITGNKGYAELDYITQELIVHENSYEKNYDEKSGHFVMSLSDSDRVHVGVDVKEPLKEEILHFLRCVAGNEAPLCRGPEAIAALKIALEAQKQINP